MMCVSARPRESRVQTVILGQQWAGRCRRRSLVPHLLASLAFAEYHPDTRSSGTYQYYIPAARGRFCLQRGVLTLATLARLTTSRSTYGRTVAEPPYSKASPDIHVRHLGTVCHAAHRHEAATRQRLEARRLPSSLQPWPVRARVITV